MRRLRRPKLGQHFLTDARYRRRIVEALGLNAEDFIIEIGAGRGEMTELLAERARRVMAIEIDPILAQKLSEKIHNRPRVEVLQTDVLSTDISELCRQAGSERCFVFGNLPYYITFPILDHLFRFWTRIRAMALLVQREVATRLTASPGSRAYGYLSVLAQFHSQPRFVFSVPPGAFSPPPKVHSALVLFDNVGANLPFLPLKGTSSTGGAPLQAGDPGKFLTFVKRCFAQKRKKLVNNLAAIHSRRRIEENLRRLALPLNVRAEQLTVEQLVESFRFLESQPGMEQ